MKYPIYASQILVPNHKHNHNKCKHEREQGDLEWGWFFELCSSLKCLFSHFINSKLAL